jgi:hypothetical protein
VSSVSKVMYELLGSHQPVAYPGISFGGWGGGSTNSAKDRENGDVGAVAP